MMRGLIVLALLAGCASAPPAPLPEPPKPPAPVALAPPPVLAVPKRLRADLDQAAPREAALVAAPSADAASIALVRELDRNAHHALADLERGGKHPSPEAVARARTAVKDLENHLNEFQASAP